MKNFTDMTDEDLVCEYQQGDQFALTELFERYKSILSRKASADSRKNGGSITEDIFFSSYLQQFWKAAERFNPSKGVPFKGWLRVKLASSNLAVLRENYYKDRTIRDEDDRLLPREGASNIPIDVTLDKSLMLKDPVSIDVMMEERNTDLYAHLKSETKKDYPDLKVVAMLLEGYSYEEIAIACGRTGNGPALRNWTMRVVERLRGAATKFIRMDEAI